MKKLVLLEAVLFGFVMCIGYIAWTFISGYLLTRYYVPDIMNSYASVDYLEQKTSFGVVYRLMWWHWAIGFFLVSILYYYIRILITSAIMKRKSSRS